jgi:DNA-binding GntR family transcriptional regulator
MLRTSRHPLVESVYESLLEAILAGRLASGTVLSEVALAAQLGVSRTPVHDALRQLAKDGLVEQQAGRRARVANFTADDLFELFEMRKFLEGPAAELAARRMDQRQLAPLRMAAESLRTSRRTSDWPLRWAEFDEQFHEVVARGSGNRRLWQDITRYRLLHRGFNKMRTETADLQRALIEHLAILDALEAHDGPAARDAMVAHIEAWQSYFVRNFASQSVRPHSSGKRLRFSRSKGSRR